MLMYKCVLQIQAWAVLRTMTRQINLQLLALTPPPVTIIYLPHLIISGSLIILVLFGHL